MVPLPSAGSSGVGFWTALLDAEVSHKSLVSLLYCLTERPKQVSLLKCYNKLCPPSLVSGLQYLGGDSVRRPKNEATDFVVWHVARFHFISFFFPDLYGSSLCNLCCPALPSAASDARSVET